MLYRVQLGCIESSSAVGIVAEHNGYTSLFLFLPCNFLVIRDQMYKEQIAPLIMFYLQNGGDNENLGMCGARIGLTNWPM